MLDIFVPEIHVANGVLPVSVFSVISYYDASTYHAPETAFHSDSYSHLLADLAQVPPQTAGQTMPAKKGNQVMISVDDGPMPPPPAK